MWPACDKQLPYTAKHSREKPSRFSQIFSPTAKDFPCMFYMLVARIHYSDEKMALTASPWNFSSERHFSCNRESFPPPMFCHIQYVSVQNWPIVSSLHYNNLVAIYTSKTKCLLLMVDFRRPSRIHRYRILPVNSFTSGSCCTWMVTAQYKIENHKFMLYMQFRYKNLS